MKKKMILIIGEGHLAYRLKKILIRSNYETLHSSIEKINNEFDSVSFVKNLEVFLNKLNVENLAMVYLLDDKDEYNLQLIISIISMYPNLAVTASLFNENLTPHLQNGTENLKILNPAKIAAPAFVDQLYIQIAAEKTFEKFPLSRQAFANKKIPLVRKILIAFISLLIAAVSFFHFYENLTWIDSFYFVIVTAASVGYGDINLSASDTLSKLVGISLILISTVSIWMIFSLTIDSLLKTRIQYSMGRKKYACKNHVIVCGLGRLGYFIVEELLKKKEKVIVIELNENSNHIDYFRQLGAEIYIGDARLPKVMRDVNIVNAKAVISVISNDSLNLEIGLNARSHQPAIKLILRIFDDEMANKIKNFLKIYHTLSASAIADDKFFEELSHTEINR